MRQDLAARLVSTSSLDRPSPVSCREDTRSMATMTDIAREAGVSLSTVKDFEAGRRSPTTASLAAFRAALEAAGVEFIAEKGGGPGVRLRKASP